MDRAKVKRMQQLMGSGIWKEDMEPLLQSNLDSVFARLRDRSKTRQEREPDEWLWGIYDTLKWILDHPKQMVDGYFFDLDQLILARNSGEDDTEDEDEDGDDPRL